jgi:hypothetical protein
MKHDLVHWPTFWLNTWLFLLFAFLAVVLWLGMPERYPAHFDLMGNPTRWVERNPAEWILLVALSTLSFGKAHLFQRFLVTDPNSTLLNVPDRKQFQRLPEARKVPVIRRVNRMLGMINTGMLLIFIAALLMIYTAGPEFRYRIVAISNMPRDQADMHGAAAPSASKRCPWPPTTLDDTLDPGPGPGQGSGRRPGAASVVQWDARLRSGPVRALAWVMAYWTAPHGNKGQDAITELWSGWLSSGLDVPATAQLP